MDIGDLYVYDSENLILEVTEINRMNEATEIVFQNIYDENDYYSLEDKTVHELIDDKEMTLISRKEVVEFMGSMEKKHNSVLGGK